MEKIYGMHRLVGLQLFLSGTPTFSSGTPTFCQMGVLNSCFQNPSESSVSTQEKWNKKLGKNRTKITKKLKKERKNNKNNKKKTIKLNLPEKSNILSRSQARKKVRDFVVQILYCSLQRAVILKKNYVCPPQSVIASYGPEYLLNLLTTKSFESNPFSHLKRHKLPRERSGSVVEYLTRDRGAAGSSLTGVTALCP